MKKGQISYVIVIAIIIIILGLGSIYYYQQSKVLPLEREIISQVFVPREGQAMYDYTIACMDIVGKEALKKIGDGGGNIYKEYNANIATPTVGNAVPASPGSDLVIPYWWHMEDDNGCISRYESANTDFPELLDKITIWAIKNLVGYTGLANIETINGKIIDCHLRMTPRFVDLYGDGWLTSVVNLYEKGTWNYDQHNKSGVSYTLRTSEEGSYIISDKNVFDDLCRNAQSVQVIFKENEVLPLNDRLVIVNGTDAQEVNTIINEFNKIIILTKE